MSDFIISINDISNKKKLSFTFIFSIILLLIGLYQFLLFHMIVELFSVFVAFSIFMLLFYSKDRIDNNYLLVLGTAFLFIGLFDFVHTLTYKGMVLFNYNQSNLPTQLWLIARYLESFSILAAVTLIARKKKIRFNRIFKIYLLIALIIIFSLVTGVFPDAFLESSGLTDFKKISEYFISLVLVLALILSYKNKEKFNLNIYKLMLLSITITIISELTFTFYNSVYGIANIIGHILKFISFYLIYELMLKKIIIEPQQFIFQKLKTAKEKWDLAAEAADLGLWELDLAKNELNFDDNFSEMLGYNKGELKPNIKQFKSLIKAQDLKKVENKMEKFFESDKTVFNLEYRMKTKAGNYKWMSNTGQVTEKGEGNKAQKFLGIHQNIDQAKRNQQRLKYLSFHDNLTALYNRRYFENELERLNYSRRYPISLIVGDLDNLKIINDSMGHKMGDKYIKMAAEIFKNVLRSEDIISRIGGDEIAVILPETEKNEVKIICSRIKEKCKEINQGENKFKGLFRVSLGFHTLNYSDQDLNHAFQKADEKMYENKRKYKNRNK